MGVNATTLGAGFESRSLALPNRGTPSVRADRRERPRQQSTKRESVRACLQVRAIPDVPRRVPVVRIPGRSCATPQRNRRKTGTGPKGWPGQDGLHPAARRPAGTHSGSRTRTDHSRRAPGAHTSDGAATQRRLPPGPRYTREAVTRAVHEATGAAWRTAPDQAAFPAALIRSTQLRYPTHTRDRNLQRSNLPARNRTGDGRGPNCRRCRRASLPTVALRP